ncbi:flagellar biosynthesis regulator FlaF [Roseovarius rhodophyticola]|uniref:Flagellar biosynthesis regulator FlaF n=1 Tax=Roseovarius rhodophyticola TaxID=3080827 RepID=A0ABZ2TND0_9RHOB|nr:flagellar biosynthesis regulator FlaF [Roseovarius sp. W115]MDV2929981.1 flagellar biosynthesis regulator FlaF [Roseovarius sp. W115]
MNATLYAQNAYRDQTQSVKTHKETEFDAFARITSRLKQASSLGRKGFKELAAALHDNRRLWTLLASDVASTSNGLSPELRARIFYLSEFTRQHSTQVLKQTGTVEPLIEINTAIMRGLRSGGQTS